MEDWSKDLVQMLDTVTLMVDEFILGVAEGVQLFAEQLENSAIEIDNCWQELFEPFADIYLELDINNWEGETSFTYPVEPTAEIHPACIGCRNYHGQAYGGKLLVCGMHPYGWDDKNCPDWESN